MFLIIESGSTKADWVAVMPSGDTHFFKTSGINPATQNDFPTLTDEDTLLNFVTTSENIYFYGAGVIDQASKSRIVQWLKINGAKVDATVESDLLAAARACCKSEPGIVSILGTGSNSCVYDGEIRIDNIPSLGYILGDEGSGSHIGKEILRAYFCRKMPASIQMSFENQFKIKREDLIENVYRQHLGSKYVASFASFLTDVDETWKKEILLKVFREFINFRIITLDGYQTYPIHFAGSIAYHYKMYLKEALHEFGLNLGNVVQQPIYELIDYHFKQIYK